MFRPINDRVRIPYADTCVGAEDKLPDVMLRVIRVENLPTTLSPR